MIKQSSIQKIILVSIFACNAACTTFERNEWTVDPFYTKKGKPNYEKNLVSNCGNPENEFLVQWDGTSENDLCQIGNSEKFKPEGSGIQWPEENFFGEQKTKCANALSSPPKMIWVPNEYQNWCPYKNPFAKNFPLTKENGWIKTLKKVPVKYKWDKVLYIVPLWRKGFSSMAPACECYDYFEIEWDTKFKIAKNHAKIITSYILSKNNKHKKFIAGKALEMLIEYEKNNAFEYLYYTPFNTNAKREPGSDKYTVFNDYSEPNFWDATLNAGLMDVLPGIIQMYGIIKEEMPENPKLSEIKKYVSDLVWLTEQGIGAGNYNPNRKLSDGKVPTPEHPNHHSVRFGYIHLLWGITAGDQKYYEAGLNHFFSNLQMTRRDGSIKSEVNYPGRAKSTHGGLTSLAHMHGNMTYHAMSAMLIKSQGHPIEKININGVTIIDSIKFSAKVALEPSIANKYSGVKSYEMMYFENPRAFPQNMSWYLLATKFLDFKPNNVLLQRLSQNENHSRAHIFGILDTDIFVDFKK